MTLEKEDFMNRKIIITLLSSALLTGITFAVSAEEKPEILVKQRQACMVLIGKYFGPLELMAKDKVPYNAEVVARNASYLEVLGKMPWDGFQESTANEKSQALPAIYKDSAKFKNAADDMQQSLATLVKMTKRGNPATVKSSIENAGKVCSFCHDKFREKKDD